jgi:hypothetical protein
MATTYTLIQSATVGAGGSASINFTSIPSTFYNLNILLSLRSTNAVTGQNPFITVNGSTSNFTWRNWYARNGGAVPVPSQSGSDNQFGTTNGANSGANVFGNFSAWIPDYAGSKQKSFISDSIVEQNATVGDLSMWGLFWNDTSAITSISFAPDVGVWAQHSTAYLYGIKRN